VSRSRLAGWAGVALALALGFVVARGTGGAARADVAAETRDFWEKREQSYRESHRGPFTAVKAWYLGYRGEAHIYVVKDSLVAEPVGRGSALRVNFAAPGFLIGPVTEKGFDWAVMMGQPVRDRWFVGKSAGDSIDIRVGRYLVSFDMQDARTGRVLVYDPDLLEERFHGFDVFEPDERFRVTARILPGGDESLDMGTSRGLSKEMVRAAVLEFELDGKTHRLSGFLSPPEPAGNGGAARADSAGAEPDPALAPEDAGPEPYFVPFRDATSGGETYGVGRYLSVRPRDDGTAVIDFNRATNPWCAYSEFYNCILPPEENELKVKVLAGEKAPADH